MLTEPGGDIVRNIPRGSCGDIGGDICRNSPKGIGGDAVGDSGRTLKGVSENAPGDARWAIGVSILKDTCAGVGEESC